MALRLPVHTRQALLSRPLPLQALLREVTCRVRARVFFRNVNLHPVLLLTSAELCVQAVHC